MQGRSNPEAAIPFLFSPQPLQALQIQQSGLFLLLVDLYSIVVLYLASSLGMAMAS